MSPPKKGRQPKKTGVTLGDLFSKELNQPENDEKGNNVQHQNISELKDGDQLESIYFCSHKMTAVTKQGKPYLNLTIADKTGEVTVRVFDDAERYGETFNQGDFLYIQGRSQLFQGAMQVIARHLEKVNAEELNPDDFMPSSFNDPDEMLGSLRTLVETIQDDHLRRLCLLMLDDPEIGPKFKRAPAAKSMHHNYVHGLLEHTLSMTLLADKACSHYKNLDRDMLLAGVVFHDIGKIYEMSYDIAIDYTDSGKLIGHITMGTMLVERLSEKIDDFPKEKKRLLEHILLSHHGTREFGSPVVPATVEANIIHHLDNLDAKVNAFLMTAEKSPTDSDWTDRHFLLGTQVRKTVEVEKGPLYGYHLTPGKPDNESD